MPRLPLSASLAALALLATTAQAGVVGQYSPNLVWLSSSALASFVGAGTELVDAAPQSPTITTSHPGYDGFVKASATNTLLPFSGTPDKDKARGGVAVDFHAGLGAIGDSFSFNSNSLASAVTATAAAGDDAYAYVQLQASFNFYLDASFSGLPAGTLVGQLSFDALRVQEAHERFWISVYDNSGLVHTVLAGDGPSTVALRIGQGYSTVYKYYLTVPHGTDPSYSLSVGGQVQVVPEPAALLLWLAGLAGITGARCARLRPPAPQGQVTPIPS